MKKPATFEVTGRALDVCDQLRAAVRALPDQAIGFVPAAGGRVDVVLDVPAAGDRVFSRHGQPILFVDAALAHRWTKKILDHGGSQGSERLFLSRVPLPGTATDLPPGHV